MKKTLLLGLFLSLLKASSPQADVTAVTVKGEDNAYHFAVTLKSEETGCKQYTDWWEVLNEKGELIYRRILIHSHPDMQPFTRSGGYVRVNKNDTVYIRAHMNNFGYTGEVFKGSVSKGFTRVKEVPDFDKKIETQTPQPEGCLY